MKEENYKLTQELGDLKTRFGIMEKKVQMASALRAENTLVVGEKKLKNGKYNKIKARRRLIES